MRNLRLREFAQSQEPESGEAETKSQASLIPKVILNSKDRVPGQE